MSLPIRGTILISGPLLQVHPDEAETGPGDDTFDQ
jgi:hypothetical protein